MAQTNNIAKLQKKIRKELDEDRYRHTLGVMYTAASLAMCYGADLEKAQTAGLLHDCAKCIPNDRKLRLCEKYGIEMNAVEHAAPSLLHAKLGAYLAAERYEINDQEILDAIRWHTTGNPGMTLLEKIIFLADYIEPMRWKAQNLDEIRREAFRDIDRAIFWTLRDTLNYLMRTPAQIDDMTDRAYHYYRDLCAGDQDEDDDQ